MTPSEPRVVCRRCGLPVPLTPSRHVRAHLCPHHKRCVVSYVGRRMGQKPERCDLCLLGRQLPLAFGER